MDIKEFSAMIGDAVSQIESNVKHIADLNKLINDQEVVMSQLRSQIATLTTNAQSASENTISQTSYNTLRASFDDVKDKYTRITKFYTILADALKYMSFDVPYVFGAEYPKGMDCSSFMQQIFGENGITLPRASYQQIKMGSSVKEVDILPGDLIVFDRIGSDDKADHIGMYVGNGLMIHTAKPGENINVTNWKKRYGTSLADIRRVF